MIISEKQIIALINNSNALILRMISSDTDPRLINEVADLLIAIEAQQSEELKEFK